MKAIGITAKENEMRGNFRECEMYSILLNYLCLDVEKVDDDTYLCDKYDFSRLKWAHSYKMR